MMDLYLHTEQHDLHERTGIVHPITIRCTRREDAM